MRIRKNANISSFTFSHVLQAEEQQPHVCSLNQSPWDAIPYPSSPINQFVREDSFDGNGSLGDSILAGESSITSMAEAEAPMLDSMVIDDKKNSPIVKESKKKKKKVNNDRAKASKKRPVISYNPNEIYYYSGFGPSWSKRRGINKVEAQKAAAAANKDSNLDAAAASISNTIPSYEELDYELDYIDDDDESGEDGGESGTKRMRKPIKARSLKSLM